MTDLLTITSALGAALAAGCVGAHLYAEPLRWWRCYLRGQVTWASCRDLFLTTALSSYLLPFKLGIPLRLVLIGRYVRLDRLAIGGLMAVDGGLVLTAWLVVSFLSGGAMLMRVLPSIPLSWFCVVVFASCLLLAIAVKKLPVLKKQVLELGNTIKNKPERALLGFALAGLDTLSYGVRHIGLALMLGLGWTEACSWLTIGILSTFVGIVSGLPLGILGYDATLLTLAAGQGFNPSIALEILAINRAMSIGGAFFLGLPSAYRLGLAANIRGLILKLKDMNRGK